MLTALSLAASLTGGPSLGPEASPNGCQAPEFEAVSWLAGDWAVVHPGSVLAFGEIRMSEIWGGCAVLETQTGVLEASFPLADGAGLLRFDPSDGVWRYGFAGDGVALRAEGAASDAGTLMVEGRMDFITGRSSRPARVTWSVMESGGVEQVIWMLDTDSGELTPWQSVHLMPLEDTPRPRTPDHWTGDP